MTEQATRRPKLDVALDQLGDTYNRLVAASRSYQSAKALLHQLMQAPDTPIEGAGLTLTIGDLALPVPFPDSAEQRVEFLEGAVNQLGQEIVRLWNLGFEVTKGAKEHCDAAMAQAAASGS